MFGSGNLYVRIVSLDFLSEFKGDGNHTICKLTQKVVIAQKNSIFEKYDVPESVSLQRVLPRRSHCDTALPPKEPRPFSCAGEEDVDGRNTLRARVGWGA